MNNNNVVNHVLQTNVHTMFKRQKGNRPINKNHLNRLTLSMKDNYLFSPILVNEKMEVIDGQHRLQAQTELNLPVPYIVIDGYGVEETRILNQNTNNWTANNFMEAFCDLRMKEYLKYRDFHNFERQLESSFSKWKDIFVQPSPNKIITLFSTQIHQPYSSFI